MQERKHKMAKRWKQVIIDDLNSIIVAVFDDLSDNDLCAHFRAAMEGQDFEYAEEVNIEANKRGFQIIYSK